MSKKYNKMATDDVAVPGGTVAVPSGAEKSSAAGII